MSSVLIRSALLVVLSLSACSPAPGDKLVFWRTLSGPAGAAVDDVAGSFAPPVETVFQGGYGALALKLRTAAAAGYGPHVSHLGTYEIRSFVSQGMLVDLSPYIDGPHGIDMSQWPGTIADAGRLGDGIYWLPYNVSVPVLYWNQDLFARAEINAAPETWTEFFDSVRRLTVRGEGNRTEVYGLGLWNITWPIVSMVWSEGGNLCSADYQRVTLDDPAAIHVLTELQALVREGCAIMPDAASGGHRALFKSGRVAMILDSQAIFGELVSEDAPINAGVALFPAGQAGRVYAPGGGGLVLCATAPAERRDEAWAFMRYLLEPGPLGTFAERSGYLAFTPESQAQSESRNVEPYRTLYAAYEHVRGDFTINAMPPVRDAFDRAFQRIMTDTSTDVAAELGRADAKAEAGLQRWVVGSE